MTLTKVTPTVKVTGLPNDANDKELYFTGSFNGWVEPGKEGSIKCTIADGSVEIELPEITLEGSGEYEYQAKFASTGWTKPEITGPNGENATFSVTTTEFKVAATYVETNTISGNDKPSENGDQYICD